MFEKKRKRSVYRETMLMFIDSDGLTYGLSIKYRSGQFLKSFSIIIYKKLTFFLWKFSLLQSIK